MKYKGIVKADIFQVCTLIMLVIVVLKCLYTVLVAHNGFAFDYRILAAEVERRNLRHELHDHLMFADTLFDLQKVYSMYHI